MSQMTSYADVIPYATVAAADSYWSNKLSGAAIWNLLNAADKLAALCEATLDIDEMKFIGMFVNTNQVRQWPRYLSVSENSETFLGVEDTFPQAVGEACCEQALYVARNDSEGHDPAVRQDHQDQGLSSVSRAGANENYDLTRGRRDKLCLPARRLLKSFIAKTGNLWETGV